MADRHWPKTYSLAIVLALFISGCGVFIPDVNENDSPHIPHLFGYQKSYLSSVLKECGLRGDFGWIRVNAAGTLMFVQETTDGVDGDILILNFVENRTERLRPPARHVWLSNDSSFSAWSDDASRQVTFANGQTRLFVPNAGSFDVDSSGEYFVVMYTQGKGCEVCRTSSPGTPLFTLSDASIWPSDIVAPGDEIYLIDDHIHAGAEVGLPSRCVAFHLRDNKYVEDRRMSIPGQFVYADSTSGRIIIREKSDLPFIASSKSVFDLRTGEKTKLSRSLAWFFLKEDYLNDRSRIALIAASSGSRKDN